MKPMFAIIENGSRQYRVEPGDTLQIDYQSDAEQGGQIVFDQVLLANGDETNIIGKPMIEGATVTAAVVDPLKKGKKIEVGIYRRRKNSRRHIGHRQKYPMVRINAIEVPGLPSAIEESSAAKRPTAKPVVEDTVSTEEE
jgi:large subunit ribosomal protein L21